MEPSTSRDIPQTSFLLQVWGALALVVLFLLLFGINCWVWNETKINYTFIFEFDTKHHLDYRQYLEVLSYTTWLIEVTIVNDLYWISTILVDIQELLASTIECDMVSTYLRLYSCWNTPISLPYPPSI
jgi:EXS family